MLQPKSSAADVRLFVKLDTPSRGAYRCVEARWLSGGNVTMVTNVHHLRELIGSWDGESPAPAAIVKAHEEAHVAARDRVERIIGEAVIVERTAVENQHASARSRLLRELARSLRCQGSGDLNTLLHIQMQRETRGEGRFHQAVRRLDGFPAWPPALVGEADEYVRALSKKQMQDRINLSSSLDAAINDPRWRITV